MQNGKGSKSRITNKKLFDKNFDQINWSNRKTIASKVIKDYSKTLKNLAEVEKKEKGKYNEE